MQARGMLRSFLFQQFDEVDHHGMYKVVDVVKCRKKYIDVCKSHHVSNGIDSRLYDTWTTSKGLCNNLYNVQHLFCTPEERLSMTFITQSISPILKEGNEVPLSSSVHFIYKIMLTNCEKLTSACVTFKQKKTHKVLHQWDYQWPKTEQSQASVVLFDGANNNNEIQLKRVGSHCSHCSHCLHWQTTCIPVDSDDVISVSINKEASATVVQGVLYLDTVSERKLFESKEKTVTSALFEMVPTDHQKERTNACVEKYASLFMMGDMQLIDDCERIIRHVLLPFLQNGMKISKTRKQPSKWNCVCC